MFFTTIPITSLRKITRTYHKNILDHYENPSNVGSFSKNEKIFYM
jgi:NifU-like protein involved in Fe-S cluster formation